MLLPEWSFKVSAQAVEEVPDAAGFLDGEVILEDLHEFWGGRSHMGEAAIGHLTINGDRLLAEGLNAVISEAERPHHVIDPDSQGEREWATYRQACAISARAVVAWAERYAEAATTAAATEPDPVRRACLARVGAACRRVPAQPARNLFEAIQSLILVHLAIHIEGHGLSVSPGRLDHLLAPYYHHDTDAAPLIAAFLLKCNSVSIWGCVSKTQAITIGGVAPPEHNDGQMRERRDALALATLEACELIRLPDPAIYLRWHRDTNPALKAKAISMLTGGLSMPLLVGDEQTTAGLIGAGIEPADAWNYCIIGCNELGVPGRLIFDAITFYEGALLREVLLDEPGGSDISSMDLLLDRVAARADEYLRRQLPGKLRHTQYVAQNRPTPFTSALMDGCLARGCDLLVGRHYEHINIRSSGFMNLANGLAAIDAVVFQRGMATLSEVAEALRVNYDGYEALHSALQHAPKWGNDDEVADRWVYAWLERRTALIASIQAQAEFTDAGNCPPLLMELVVRSLHRVEGKPLGATPDGRRAGEPLGDSIGAPGGITAAGPTAILNSVRRAAPARHWPGGYNLNLTLPAMAMVDGTGTIETHAKIQAMVEAFFAGGGQELQVAALSAGRLREARAHPERHPDLMVRIAGFNAFYTRLAPGEQEEILRRAEMCGTN
jgi:formate C-acetyltransferase